jgi:hypothetical protein
MSIKASNEAAARAAAFFAAKGGKAQYMQHQANIQAERAAERAADAAMARAEYDPDGVIARSFGR